MADTKICRSCGIEKSVEDFYAKGVLKSGKKRYRPDCIGCTIAALDANKEERERIRLAAAAWRKADPERGRKSCRDSRNRHIDERRAAQRAARFDPAKRPAILAAAKGSYERHKDQRLIDMKAWETAHPEHRQAYGRAYWKNNPEKAAECRAARRARKAGAEGFHTAKDIKALRISQNDICNNPMCSVTLNGRGSVDHIVALVNGGSNWPSNLQLLCKSCNSRKRSRDNEAFLESYAREHNIAMTQRPETPKPILPPVSPKPVGGTPPSRPKPPYYPVST